MSSKHNGVPDAVSLIDRHLNRFFNEQDILVLHEKKSVTVHSDIYIVKASADRPYNLLLSSGLSALPMNVPEELEHLKYAEIAMLLPADWNLDYEGFADENHYWPFRALMELSKYPHENNTWFGYGHTIPLDTRQKVSHRFHSIILLESITLPYAFMYIDGEDKEAYIYSAIPIYKEELEYQLQSGTEKLLEKFEHFDIDEIVDVNRRNVCAPQ